MSFLVRFIMVIVWMVSISASSFAITKRCTKTDKVIPHQNIKTSQKTNHNSPTATNKSVAICAGGMSLYCIQYKEMIIFQSHNNITYPRFITAIPLSGFSKLPYAPPRYILNI
ncbi:MAG: hypothetical protein WKF85_02510 [Chitinophagaceae bacterium]